MQSQLSSVAPETVAAITAVLAVVLERPAEQLVIRSISAPALSVTVPARPSAWAMAGRLGQLASRGRPAR